MASPESNSDKVKSVKNMTFLCKICNKTFNKKGRLRNHVQTHAERVHTCHICNKSFPVKSYLDSHMKTHESNRALYKCPICSKEFKILNYLDTHIKLHTAEKVYECDVCFKTFKIKHYLYLHKRTHSEKVFVCPICSKAFAINKYLVRHMRTHSNEHDGSVNVLSENQNAGESVTESTMKSLFSCSVCAKTFTLKGSLTRHMKKHLQNDENSSESNENCSENVILENQSDITESIDQEDSHLNAKLFVCALCSTEFTDIQILLNHMTTHSNETNDDQFEITNVEVQTIQSKVPKIKKPITCRKCFKTFASPSTLTHHKNLQRCPRGFKCHFCGRFFKKYFLLTYHLKGHKNNDNNHLEGEGPEQSVAFFEDGEIKCHMCYQTFFSKHSLTCHLRTHTKEKTYECYVCYQKFLLISSLRNHMRTHFPKLSFKCKLCNQIFTSKSVLINHMRVHRRENTYNCRICSKVFFKQYALDKHVLAHGIVTLDNETMDEDLGPSFENQTSILMYPELEDDRFPCSICHKTFFNEYSLKRHVRTHTGEKPFSCDICSKSFSQSSNLANHKLLHSDEKQFTCTVCSTSFKQKSILLNHQKIHRKSGLVKCPFCPKVYTSDASLRAHKSRTNCGKFQKLL